MSRYKVSRFRFDKMKHSFENQIFPLFNTNIPASIRQAYKTKPSGKYLKTKLVSIELMLMNLFAATVTGTSIQNVNDILGEMQSNSSYGWNNLPEDIKTNTKNLPDPSFVRRSLKLWQPKQIRSRFRKLIKKQIKEMKPNNLTELIHGKFGDEGFSAAFDLTEVKYYGKNVENMEYIDKSKKKGGSKYCFSYLTLQIICSGLSLIIDVEPIYEDSEPIGIIMVSMLKRAKRAHLKIRNIYVDRGFYTAEILQTFNDKLSRRLLMPTKRTPIIKKTIRSIFIKKGYTEGKTVVKIKSQKTGHEQKYTMIYKPKSEADRKKLRMKQKRCEDDMNLDLIDQVFFYFCLLEPPRRGKTMAEVFDQVALELKFEKDQKWN